MPVSPIRLAKSQIRGLRAACEIGVSELARIRSDLGSTQATISRRKIQRIVASKVGPDTAKVLTRLLVGLARYSRRRSISPNELVEGLTEDINSSSDYDEIFRAGWKACRPE